MKKKRLDKRLDMAKFMPKLRHTLPGEEFDASSSEVLQWIASEPELMLYLFDKIHTTGKIEYDLITGTWRGTANKGGE